MKLKILSFVLLTVILSLTLISAADFTITITNDLSKSVNSTLVKIKNTNTTDSITVNIGDIADISDGDQHTILITQNKVGSFTLAPNAEETINVSYSDFNPSNTDFEDLALGTFTTSISVTQGTETITRNINFVSSFCEDGERQEVNSDGTRRLEIVKVSDQSSADEWEWRPLDKVELEVEVRFRSGDNNDDIDGIIETALYDTENQDFIDIGDSDQLEIDFSLDEGEKATETINIELPVEDIEDSSNRYRLYVKAYEDGDQNVVCSDIVDFDKGDDNAYFQDIKIKKESSSVVIDEIDVTTPVPCGAEVQVNYRVFNIGSKDEDRAQVYLTNTQLGLDLESEVFQLDEGDSESASFNFIIPTDAKEGSYNLRMYTAFRYSSSTDNFRERSEDFFPDVPLVIEGSCSDSENGNGGNVNGTTQQNIQITADLDPETPEAVAGENVVIKANLLNTGSATTTYSVSVFGNSAWSNVVSVNPQIITLEPGQSRTVDITLSVDDEASGNQEFTIKTTYGTNKSKEQRVELSIVDNGTSTGNLDSVTEHFRKNWFIYVIIIVNLILIIAIIAVIRRITRPRRTVIHEM